MLGIIVLGVLLTISVLQITYYMVTIKEELEHNKAMEKEWEKYLVNKELAELKKANDEADKVLGTEEA